MKHFGSPPKCFTKHCILVYFNILTFEQCMSDGNEATGNNKLPLFRDGSLEYFPFGATPNAKPFHFWGNISEKNYVFSYVPHEIGLLTGSDAHETKT